MNASELRKVYHNRIMYGYVKKSNYIIGVMKELYNTNYC